MIGAIAHLHFPYCRSLLAKMATNLVGLAFIPYYKHLMELLETNAELKKTSKGKNF